MCVRVRLAHVLVFAFIVRFLVGYIDTGTATLFGMLYPYTHTARSTCVCVHALHLMLYGLFCFAFIGLSSTYYILVFSSLSLSHSLEFIEVVFTLAVRVYLVLCIILCLFHSFVAISRLALASAPSVRVPSHLFPFNRLFGCILDILDWCVVAFFRWLLLLVDSLLFGV